MNHDYFEVVDSKEKAYWLGFLYADGCVYYPKKGCGTIHLYLALKDEGQIDTFISIIGYTNKKYYTKEAAVGVCISSNRLASSLINNGCVPCKSKIIRLPTFSDRGLDLAFLLGYFDGDGYFSDGYNTALLTSGSQAFLKDVKDYYDLNNNLVRNGSGCWKLTLGQPLYYEMIENFDYGMSRKRPVNATYKPRTSKYRGVTWNRCRGKGKWQAQIYINGKPKYLGLFVSEEDAFSAIKTARNVL